MALCVVPEAIKPLCGLGSCPNLPRSRPAPEGAGSGTCWGAQGNSLCSLLHTSSFPLSLSVKCYLQGFPQHFQWNKSRPRAGWEFGWSHCFHPWGSGHYSSTGVNRKWKRWRREEGQGLEEAMSAWNKALEEMGSWSREERDVWGELKSPEGLKGII